MSGIQELCGRARPQLAALGDLGLPLLAVVDVAERVAGARGPDVLCDPAFALEVLTATPAADAATVGRVLDFLRRDGGAAPVAARAVVTVADAVTSYEASALALMATGTGHTYRTWTRRLVTKLGDVDVDTVTTGDLTDVIAATAGTTRAGRRSRGATENAVAAYRHAWGYFCEKGWARANVARDLRKPARGEPRRRAIRPAEAALLRQLASLGRDPLLDEVTLTLAERLGLRRIEICRLRLCDLDLCGAEARVWGKGDKDRTMPMPPRLVELLRDYVEDRRPGGCPPQRWVQRGDLLLRHRPTPAHPEGVPTGRRRIEDLFSRLARGAPDVFARGDLSLHSYRHALATFVDARWGRPVTRAVLGHTSSRSPTDAYVHVDPSTVAEALACYEAYMLGSPTEPATPGISSSLTRDTFAIAK